MATGVEQLREQLAAMEHALQAFDDPLVNQRPGLRLMHATLRERHGHIGEQIRKNETCSVTLTFRGAATQGRSLAAGHLLGVLDPVAAATQAAAQAHVASWSPAPDDAVLTEAAQLHVAELTFEDADAQLLLTRNPGGLQAQLTDPDSQAPMIEHALRIVTACLRGAQSPPAVAAALAPLATWVLEAGIVLEWAFEGYVVDSDDATIDLVAAQRFLQAQAG